MIGLLGLLALAACGEGSLASLSVRLHVTRGSAGGACPAPGSDLPLLQGLPSATRLRVTWRTPGSDTALCDAVLEVGDGHAGVLGVPEGADAADLLVEAFDQGGTLLASGSAVGVDLRATATTKVLLVRTETFSCAPAPLLFGRAFHSATLLPNGEALIVGGVVADPTDPAVRDVDLDVSVGANVTGGLYATNSVEVYDPRSGTFARYQLGELTARALHEAYLLSAPGEGGGYQVLLLGGLKVSGNPADAPVADLIRDGDEALPLVPGPDAVGVSAEILTYLPAERRLTRRELTGATAPQVRSLPAVSRAPSPGDAVGQAPPLVAGGWLDYPGEPALSFEGIDAASGVSLGNTDFFSAIADQARGGATVTWIRDDRALVFGGNLGSAAGQEEAQAGIVVSGVQNGGEQSGQMILDAASEQPVPRAGHTATAIGPAEVLIAGGFAVRAGSGLDPATPFVQRVSFAGNDQNPPATFVTVPPGDVGAFGFHDAVALSPGVVLLAGGRGTGGASREAFRYEGGAFAPVGSEMAATRYGLRLTLLADGSVLVTGGLSVGLSPETTTVADVELYNPRTAASDPRPPGEAAGPACAIVR